MNHDPNPDPPALIPRPARGRILLADDDEPFRDGLSKLLCRLGFDCIVAPDAPSAADILREKEVDALISDIHMPGNAGLELIESVPLIRRGLPIILLTGKPAFETAAKSVRLSVAAYLVKPPDIRELTAILDENIARFRSLKAVSASRERIDQWSRELEQLEEILRRPSTEKKHNAGYLRLTLHNMAVQLVELAQAATASQMEEVSDDLDRFELIAALKQTIAVLENTRKSFKSKELGELRRQLSELLAERTRAENSSSS